MDMRRFNAAWEVEYISERVKRISKAVEDGNYEKALDYLNMIHSKVKEAEHVIISENIRMCNKER